MSKKKIAIIALAAIVIAGGSFYGGMIYGQSKTPGFGAGQNLTAEQRQQFAQNPPPRMDNGTRGANGNFTTGEVTSKDDKSITIKTINGGSKIVFYADSTAITKSAEGTIDNISTGTQLTITGTSNSDGSITAKTIQIRPAMPNIGQTN